MRRKFWKDLLLFACALALGGCSSTPKPPSENGGLFRQHNEGYSLLYKLMKDESDVGEIFIIKSADDPVKRVVKEIGSACQAASKLMDEFPKQNNRIEYDVPDLPYMEQRSRDLQAGDDEKALLTSSGKEFERRLIFTQAEATNYAMQLCKALDEKETDPGRKGFLENLAKQCGDFHDRLMDLLAVQS
ncbi:MAG: hypothetical protein ABSH08_06220 [Tepidisphaeraceae bacterium]|jgi:hypothetical protein